MVRVLNEISTHFAKTLFYLISECSDNKGAIQFQSEWAENQILAGILSAPTEPFVQNNTFRCLQTGPVLPQSDSDGTAPSANSLAEDE